MLFDHMWRKDVHESVAVEEIKEFEEKWIGEDELFKLFYGLKMKKTENKVNERNIIHYFVTNRLIETKEVFRITKFKITKEGLRILEHFYIMIYLGTS